MELFSDSGAYFAACDVGYGRIETTGSNFQFSVPRCRCKCCWIFLWNLSTKWIGAVKTSVYIYVSPVVTVVLSMFVLDEKMTVASVSGSILILVGLIVSQKRKKLIRKRGNRNEKWQKTGLLIVWCIIIAGCFILEKN